MFEELALPGLPVLDVDCSVSDDWLNGLLDEEHQTETRHMPPWHGAPPATLYSPPPLPTCMQLPAAAELSSSPFVPDLSGDLAVVPTARIEQQQLVPQLTLPPPISSRPAMPAEATAAAGQRQVVFRQQEATLGQLTPAVAFHHEPLPSPFATGCTASGSPLLQRSSPYKSSPQLDPTHKQSRELRGLPAFQRPAQPTSEVPEDSGDEAAQRAALLTRIQQLLRLRQQQMDADPLTPSEAPLRKGHSGLGQWGLQLPEASQATSQGQLGSLVALGSLGSQQGGPEERVVPEGHPRAAMDQPLHAQHPVLRRSTPPQGLAGLGGTLSSTAFPRPFSPCLSSSRPGSQPLPSLFDPSFPALFAPPAAPAEPHKRLSPPAAPTLLPALTPTCQEHKAKRPRLEAVTREVPDCDVSAIVRENAELRKEVNNLRALLTYCLHRGTAGGQDSWPAIKQRMAGGVNGARRG